MVMSDYIKCSKDWFKFKLLLLNKFILFLGGRSFFFTNRILRLRYPIMFLLLIRTMWIKLLFLCNVLIFSASCLILWYSLLFEMLWLILCDLLFSFNSFSSVHEPRTKFRVKATKNYIFWDELYSFAGVVLTAIPENWSWGHNGLYQRAMALLWQLHLLVRDLWVLCIYSSFSADVICRC